MNAAHSMRKCIHSQIRDQVSGAYGRPCGPSATFSWRVSLTEQQKLRHANSADFVLERDITELALHLAKALSDVQIAKKQLKPIHAARIESSL
jgi:hypothetical protein